MVDADKELRARDGSDGGRVVGNVYERKLQGPERAKAEESSSRVDEEGVTKELGHDTEEGGTKKMDIVTKYRDIPFEEAVKCSPKENSHYVAAFWESNMRGKMLVIETPANGVSDGAICEGPFFRVLNRCALRGGKLVACPHIAEIGD